MRRSLIWFLAYGATVLGGYAFGGFRGAWRMHFPSGSSEYGQPNGYHGTGGGYGGGFRGGK